MTAIYTSYGRPM